MGAVALEAIMHRGRVFEPGSELPEGPWVAGLIERGKAKPEESKPKRAAKPKAEQ